MASSPNKTAFVLHQGTFAKTSESYEVTMQTIDNLDEITRLHQEIFDRLEEHEKPYLIERDKSYFENHFEQGHVVVGVVHNGRLVAQALMTLPSEEYPYTGMTDMNMSSLPLEKIAVLNGAIVHPDYRGNSLQTVLTEARIKLAEMRGREHLVSEVAVNNRFSWSTLLKSGLSIHSLGTDSDDGTQLYNLHIRANDRGTVHKLRNEFNHNSRRNIVSCSQNNLEAQQILISLGYRGVANDIAGQTIQFARLPKKKSGGHNRKP